MRAPSARASSVLAILLVACQSSEYEGGLDLERMVDQPRFDAYDATSIFPDSMAMRTPPEGILPFGDVAPAAVRTGHDGGAPLDRIPIPVDSVLMAEGRKEFGVYCTPCHGWDGHASTPVAAVMEIRRPPSLHQERIRTMPPGHLYDIIAEGYGMMPGYGATLDARERWAVAAYVQALLLSRWLPVDTLPAAARASVIQRLERATGPSPDVPDSTGVAPHVDAATDTARPDTARGRRP